MKFILTILFIISCSGGETKDSNASTSTSGGGMVDIIKQQAESEQGKKAIESIKEKLKDPKTQEKLKGLMGGSKTTASTPTNP
jgi:hypothetical protein